MKRYTFDGVAAVLNYTDRPGDGEVDGVEVIAISRLGQEFRRLCDDTGLKFQALAGVLGITPKTLSNYCAGKTAPPPLIWKEVAARKLK